ncbi:MAG: FecR domain-containing protein [Acidobacteriota bacterium]|nr:MAG: FecR domain-containing protein [Acidobacteriota bacterium]
MSQDDRDRHSPRPGGSSPPDATDPRDPVAQLLRRAGPRASLDAARREHAKRRVREVWLAEVARRQRRARRGAGMAIAASVLVAVVGALMWRASYGPDPDVSPRARVEMASGLAWVGGQQGQPLSRGAQIGPGDEVRTGPDGRLAMRLAGGESLRVGGDTHFVLRAAADLELLSGLIYIDAGGAQPDIVRVETPLGRIIDIGTQFEVRLSDDALRVRVREGAVRVEQDGRGTIVRDRSSVSVNRNGDVQTSDIAIYGASWNWVVTLSPTFELEGRRLSEFLVWVGRETGLRVEFAEPELARAAGEIELHGSLAGTSPIDAPAIVLPTCGLTHRIMEGKLLIEKGR